MTAKYQSSHLASYCLEAHEKVLNDTIGNLTQPQLSDCINISGVGNISISNIMSTTISFRVIICLL